MNAIEVRNLRKSYGSIEAVRGVDLSVGAGEIFALLGPNGAGKTTIVEILEGHRDRSSGDVTVLGFDPGKHPRALKQRIGIVLQQTGVEPYLTVAEAIDLYRGYYPAPLAVDEIIAIVGLEEQRNHRVSKLSGGQARRLDVAIGLAGDPELLFLDEPTTGFDPSARRQAWEMVKNLRSLGKSVLLTTHYMDEAQALADRVAVISKGQVLAEGPPSMIGRRDTAVTTIRFRTPSKPVPTSFDPVVSGGMTIVRAPTPTATLAKLTTWAVKHNFELHDLTVSRPTLEDAYLELTGADDE